MVNVVHLLQPALSTDAVSDLLRSVRIRSTLYCRSRLSAPWGFATDAGPAAAFHAIVTGGGWLDVDESGQLLRLQAGDLVILPAGQRHSLRDERGTPTPALPELLAEHPVDPHRRLRFGGGGARTVLLCGGFTVEGGQRHPVLQALPPVIHIRGRNGRPVSWLAASLRLVEAELRSPSPGSEAVITRLTDALLTQALRLTLSRPEAAESTDLRALQDPRVAAAIGLIHQHPHRAWTLEELAAGAALSRSAFAARFRRFVGEPPMRYATRIRLAHAAGLLQSTQASLVEIARRTGYDNEFSLSKAFKRAYGVAPGSYRRRTDTPAPHLAVATRSSRPTTRPAPAHTRIPRPR
jgi:AraC-like DNA-binding protein